MSQQGQEKEAVRTTIVGGRPPGCGRGIGDVPRGVEVLLKKASVDAQFRDLLLEQRASAAAAIELHLDPAECAMLAAIPREQLEDVLAGTVVPVDQRRVFLGRLAAPMLALLAATVVGCGPEPAQSAGSEPDLPAPKATDASLAVLLPGATNEPFTNPAMSLPSILTHETPTVITAGVRP
jgi:hypothetical protein